jgi:hypothetical protein
MQKSFPKQSKIEHTIAAGIDNTKTIRINKINKIPTTKQNISSKKSENHLSMVILP